MLSLLATAALLLTPPGTPAGGFRWQRLITPPAGSGMQQACVVLDAATFANASPALSDLRLFQDGTELPYVVEESYDERALDSGITPADDRSAYETVYTGRMVPRPGAGYRADFFVDAHVPVERVRLEPVPEKSSVLRLSAAGNAGAEHEEAEASIDAGHPGWPFTLGANLQERVRVTVTDETSGARTERVVLEMRRRSLCYEPRSASPLVLYLGGGQGMAAKFYSLANGFSTALERPFATMGPLEPNPDLRVDLRKTWPRTKLAIAVLLVALLLTLGITLSRTRRQTGRPMRPNRAAVDVT